MLPQPATRTRRGVIMVQPYRTRVRGLRLTVRVPVTGPSAGPGAGVTLNAKILDPMTSAQAMNTNQGLPLIAPRVVPALDPGFRPAVLAVRAFRALVDATPGAVPVRIAVEQADGSVFRFEIRVLPESHPNASGNFTFLER